MRTVTIVITSYMHIHHYNTHTLHNPIRKSITLIIWTAWLFIIVTITLHFQASFLLLYTYILPYVKVSYGNGKQNDNIETVPLIDFSTHSLS